PVTRALDVVPPPETKPAQKPAADRNDNAVPGRDASHPVPTVFAVEQPASPRPAAQDPPTQRPDSLTRGDPGPSRPLFNGRDLTGWTAYKCEKDDWEARDGVLTNRNIANGWLMTE